MYPRSHSHVCRNSSRKSNKNWKILATNQCLWDRSEKLVDLDPRPQPHIHGHSLHTHPQPRLRIHGHGRAPTTMPTHAQAYAHAPTATPYAHAPTATPYAHATTPPAPRQTAHALKRLAHELGYVRTPMLEYERLTPPCKAYVHARAHTGGRSEECQCW